MSGEGEEGGADGIEAGWAQPLPIPGRVATSESAFRPIERIAVGAAEPPRLDAKPIRSADFRLTPYRPDTLLDSWDAGPLAVRAASVRGDSHRYYGVPRQDDMTLVWDADAEVLVIAVADGVSGAPHSQLGASVACRYAVEYLLHNSAAEQPPDWSELLEGCAWAIIEAGQRLRALAAPDPHQAERDLATTLCVARIMATDEGIDVRAMSVGDSGLGVVRDQRIVPLLGGKAPPLDGVIETAVIPLPRVPATLPTGEWTIRSDETLLIATDGIWDPVGQGTGDVARLLAEVLGRSLPGSPDFLRIVDLYKETHDDDRTLVAVRVREPRPAPEGPATAGP